MKVRELMTANVVSCRKDTDLASAARLMLEKGCGTLPVVDEHGRVAGILTDRDIAMAAATRQRNAAHIAVHEAMSGHPATCLAKEDIATALTIMEERRVRRLPVLDGDGRLSGIVSIDDIVLRGLDGPSGIPTATFVQAMRRLLFEAAGRARVQLRGNIRQWLDGFDSMQHVVSGFSPDFT